jgi:hypothetical protein
MGALLGNATVDEWRLLSIICCRSMVAPFRLRLPDSTGTDNFVGCLRSSSVTGRGTTDMRICVPKIGPLYVGNKLV